MNQHQHLVDSKRKFALLIIVLGSIIAIGPLAIDMYLPAFLEIAHSFNSSESSIQISLTTYFIGTALGQLFYGPIIDRFGRRIPLLFGLTIFTFSSAACFFAKNAEQLAILRFFQAIGACAGVVIPRTIVRDIFSLQDSAKVFSHLLLVAGISPILAPIIGSFFLYNFGWRSIFVFMVLFGIALLFCVYLFLPITKAANKNDRISYALKKYLGILRDRNFLVCALSGGLVTSGMFAYITGSPFVYIEIFQIAAKNYGWAFAINAFGYVLFAQINVRLLRKFSIEQILAKVFFVPAILGLVLIFLSLNQPSFWPVAITIFFFIAFIGMINPSTTALALANQAAHAGSASALFGALQFTIATCTSLAVSKFHDGSALPMSFVVGSCGILACFIFKFFRKRN